MPRSSNSTLAQHPGGDKVKDDDGNRQQPHGHLREGSAVTPRRPKSAYICRDPNEHSDGGQLMAVQIDTAALNSRHHDELQGGDLRTP